MQNIKTRIVDYLANHINRNRSSGKSTNTLLKHGNNRYWWKQQILM